MTKEDYKLLINICYQCLRSSSLTVKQNEDIDKLLPKLYNKAFNTKKKKGLRLTKKH